jgi:maleylpyruvate isomerase
MSQVIKLYNYWRSSASWRVRIALAYKRVPYQYLPVHLLQDGGEQYQPQYREINPLSQVPVLELDDGSRPPRRIAQSMAILEYLEERFPAPRLLPEDAWERARARMLAEMVNSGIQPLQNAPGVLAYVKHALGGDEQAFARHFVSRGLAALERSALETAGAFLVGDQPSLADVCLVPQLFAARRFGVDLTPLPTLLAVERACEALAPFAEARPERQPDAKPSASAGN